MWLTFRTMSDQATSSGNPALYGMTAAGMLFLVLLPKGRTAGALATHAV